MEITNMISKLCALKSKKKICAAIVCIIHEQTRWNLRVIKVIYLVNSKGEILEDIRHRKVENQYWSVHVSEREIEKRWMRVLWVLLYFWMGNWICERTRQRRTDSGSESRLNSNNLKQLGFYFYFSITHSLLT